MHTRTRSIGSHKDNHISPMKSSCITVTQQTHRVSKQSTNEHPVNKYLYVISLMYKIQLIRHRLSSTSSFTHSQPSSHALRRHMQSDKAKRNLPRHTHSPGTFSARLVYCVVVSAYARSSSFFFIYSHKSDGDFIHSFINRPMTFSAAVQRSNALQCIALFVLQHNQRHRHAIGCIIVSLAQCIFNNATF